MRPIIIYIMGVSGSGKTTVGKKLSGKISLPFFDADDFHSAANKEKMKAGIPLTDDDRIQWLQRLNELGRQHAADRGAVIACSALKDRYRQVLSDGITVPLLWAFLQGNYELIKQRMETRTDHYMPASLLTSQFEALEIPQQCIPVDISNDPDKIVETLVAEIETIINYPPQ